MGVTVQRLFLFLSFSPVCSIWLTTNVTSAHAQSNCLFRHYPAYNEFIVDARHCPWTSRIATSKCCQCPTLS